MTEESKETPWMRPRTRLLLWLATCWFLLALSREALFDTYQQPGRLQQSFAYFANLVGLVHALLFTLAMSTFASPTSSIGGRVGASVAMVMTIALARLSYPFDLLVTSHAMLLRSLVYIGFACCLLRARGAATHPRAHSNFRLTLVDGLLLMLVVAVFMGAARSVWDRIDRVSWEDWVYLRRDAASLALAIIVGGVEALIGCVCLFMRRRAPRFTIGLAAIAASVLAGSLAVALASQWYNWFQFGYPLARLQQAGAFSASFATVLSFSIWTSIFSLSLPELAMGFDSTLEPKKPSSDPASLMGK